MKQRFHGAVAPGRLQVLKSADKTAQLTRAVLSEVQKSFTMPLIIISPKELIDATLKENELS
jgi:fructoselysine-6-P-deglycase FrlB-like protein